jgi:hypothetical protein
MKEKLVYQIEKITLRNFKYEQLHENLMGKSVKWFLVHLDGKLAGFVALC